MTELNEDVTKPKRAYTYKPHERLNIQFNATITKKILEMSAISHTSPTQWVTEIIELYLAEHRNGRSIVTDPERYSDRDAGDDTMYT